jgi:hypothetical protein
MSLNDQQKRYINLSGNPVHLSFWHAARHRATMQAVGVAGVFNLCVMNAGTGNNGLAAVAGSVVGAAFVAGFMNTVNDGASSGFGHQHEILCIDKAPDQYTTPTTVSYIDKARNLRVLASVTSTTMASVAGLITSEAVPLAIAAQNVGGMETGVLAFVVTMGTGIAATFAEMTHRFHKVAKGDWVITNTPAPVKSGEKAAHTTVLNHT